MFELPIATEGLSYTPTASGHAWVLPRRKRLGKLRLLGLIPIVLSLFFPAVIWVFVRGFFQGFGGPGWVPTLGPLLLAALVFMGQWKFWRIGVAILIGRSEVRLEGENIIAIERMPFRSWKRTLEMSKVSKIEVSGPSESGKPGPMRDLVGITLYDQKQKWPLVIGYPLAMLEPLAVQVADHINDGRAEPVPVEMFRGTLEEMRARDREDETPAEPEPVPDQPTDSTAVLTENNGELSIELPAIGLRKGSKGLFTFAIVWNLFVLVMLVGLSIAAFRGRGPSGGELLLVGGVFLIFGGVGVLVLVNAISMGKRHTIIDVVGDSLLISTTTPFRSRQHTFLAEDLGAIRAGPSGTEINEVPVLELQIHHRATPLGNAERPAGFAKLGVLSSRPDEELKWLAAVLRDRLGVASKAPDPELGRGLHVRVGSKQVI